jgi:Leucine-rich repeat (LRR) protein
LPQTVKGGKITNGEGWEDQDNWMTGIDHCDWEGVSCNSDRYVEILNLYGNNLIGPIPQSIGYLVNLEELDLAVNELTGPIPDAIGNLVNLEWLWLNGNNLTGPIPETIGNLVKLRQGILRDNQLTGPFPQSIGNLVNLERLDLRRNYELDPTPPAWLAMFCKGIGPPPRCDFCRTIQECQ